MSEGAAGHTVDVCVRQPRTPGGSRQQQGFRFLLEAWLRSLD